LQVVTIAGFFVKRHRRCLICRFERHSLAGILAPIAAAFLQEDLHGSRTAQTQAKHGLTGFERNPGVQPARI
jgi:hypothetical protein